MRRGGRSGKRCTVVGAGCPVPAYGCRITAWPRSRDRVSPDAGDPGQRRAPSARADALTATWIAQSPQGLSRRARTGERTLPDSPRQRSGTRPSMRPWSPSGRPGAGWSLAPGMPSGPRPWSRPAWRRMPGSPRRGQSSPWNRGLLLGAPHMGQRPRASACAVRTPSACCRANSTAAGRNSAPAPSGGISHRRRPTAWCGAGTVIHEPLPR